jgi:hypothetical protein
MLLTTIDQFQDIIPNLDAGFEDLTFFQPYINTAEDWIKRDIIGENLYNDLNTASGDNSGEIYNKCRSVIALYSYFLAIPDLDVIQTNAGLGVVNNQDFAPASKERTKKLQENIQKRMNVAIEDLIDYLIGSDSTYFNKWKESSAHDKIYSVLVYSTRDFSEYYDLYDNRTLYLALRNEIKAVERTKIAGKISQAFLNQLKTAQKDYELNEKHNAILPDLKYAIIYYAMSSALYSEKISMQGNTALLHIPNDPFIRANNRQRQSDFYSLARQFLDKVINYLNNNIDDYSTYADSDEYARQTYSGWENDDETDPIFVGPS